MGRSFWRSAHIRYFSQINFSSSGAKCNSPATFRGRQNDKRHPPALPSIRQVVKAGYESSSVCELRDEFICRSLNSAQHGEFLCMGSLYSARKEVFESEAERSREKGKRTHSLGNASAPPHLLSSGGGWGIAPSSEELLWFSSHLLALKRKSEQSGLDIP